jgi:hypothetical protein
VIYVKRFILLLFLVLSLLGGFFLLRSTREAKALNLPNFTHKDWSNWGKCKPTSCGTYEGTQKRTCEFQLFGTDQCDLNEVEYRECEVKEDDYYECEVEVTPTLTPTPTEEPSPEPEVRVISTAGAPTCDGVPFVKLPANFHVIRRGDQADLIWVPTAGNEVSIFFHENENVSNAHGFKTNNDGFETVYFLGSKNWTFGLLQWDGCATSGTVWVVDDYAQRLFRPLPYQW